MICVPFGMGIRFFASLNEFPTVMLVSSGAILGTLVTCGCHEAQLQRKSRGIPEKTA